MNYAAFVFQEERVLAHQPIHHVPPQDLLAIHPDHPLAAYRAVLEFNVVELSAYRNHPASYEIVLAVIPLERLSMVRNADVHARGALVAHSANHRREAFVVSTAGRYRFPIKNGFVS